MHVKFSFSAGLFKYESYQVKITVFCTTHHLKIKKYFDGFLAYSASKSPHFGRFSIDI